MAEFGDVRDRSADFDSAEEDLIIVDILDDEDDTPADTEGQSGEEWQSLDIAEEAEISRVRSMKRTSAKKDVVASGAKRTQVSLGGSTKVNVIMTTCATASVWSHTPRRSISYFADL